MTKKNKKKASPKIKVPSIEQLQKNSFKSELKTLGLIFLISIIVRLIFLIDFQKLPYAQVLLCDSLFHDNWAQQILKGDFFSLQQGDVLYKAPFYPYFMALVYLIFGHNYLAVQLVQVILGSCSCCLVYLIGRCYFNKTSSFIASIIYSLYFMAIIMDVELEILSVAIFLTLLSFYLLVINFTYLKLILSGFFLALSILALPTNLLLLPLFGFYLFKKYDYRKMLLYLSIAAITICPITLRNLLVGHNFTLVSANNGINLYVGNNKEYDKTVYITAGLDWKLFTQPFYSSPLNLKGYSHADEDRFWLQKAFQEINKDSFYYIRLAGKKLILYFMNYEIMRNIDDYYLWENSVLSKIPFITVLIIFPLGILGLIIAFYNDPKKHYLLITSLVLLIAPSIIYFMTSRYRLPTMPFWSIYAGFGFTTLVTWLKNKKWKQVSLGLLLICMVGLFVWSNLYIHKNSPSSHYYDFTLINNALGNYDQVIENGKKCLRITKTDPEKKYTTAEVSMCMGFAYYMKNELTPALKYIDQSLAIWPLYQRALFVKGAIYLKEKEYAKAFNTVFFAINKGFLDPEFKNNSGYQMFIDAIVGWKPSIFEVNKFLKDATDDKVKEILTYYLQNKDTIK